MRTHVGQPVRLADYRVPDFLIDSVDLDISLDRSVTRVVATLALRPHPEGRVGAALELDGDELALTALRLDGGRGPSAYDATPSALGSPSAPASFHAADRNPAEPAANTKLIGLPLR